jgi:transcriptional regulator with XRE-family HTH domain
MNTASSKVRCNGEKVRQRRTELSMTQEILAHRSNVDCRTVQRAEKSAPLQLETLASLAATLKVTVNELIQDDGRTNSTSDATAESKERNAVVLRRVVSGKALLDIVCDSFSGKVYCNAEPTSENIDVLSAIVEKLEKLIPNPWENPMENNTVTLADRLRAAVILTAELAELEKAGVAVYAGTYTASAQVPHYDMDEGCMYVRTKQRHEPVTVCRVFVERLGVERIIVKVDDEWEEPAPASPSLLSRLGADDEIPF